MRRRWWALAVATTLALAAPAARAASTMLLQHWSPVLDPGQSERVVIRGGTPPFDAYWIAPDGRRIELPVTGARSRVLTVGRPASIRIIGGAETGILVVEDRRGQTVRRPLTMESALAADQQQAPSVTPYAALVPMAMVTAALAALVVIMRRARQGR